MDSMQNDHGKEIEKIRAEYEARIRQLQRDNDVSETNLKNLNNEKDQKIKDLEYKISKLEDDLRNRDNDISDKDREIMDLQQQLRDLKRQLDDI